MNRSDELLVIIVNYRVAERVGRLLAGGALAGHRVLLADNASQPGEMSRLADRHGAEVLLLDRNYGFAGAVNRALAVAGSPGRVLLVNPDVDLTRSDLDGLTAALGGGLTAVCPLLVGRGGEIQVGTAGGPATPGGFARYFLLLSHLFPRARGVFYTRRQLRYGLDPDWLCMACLLARADAFATYGPVPEHELVYAEDVAWGIAASRRGARFAVVSDVVVAHEQGASGGSRRWARALARLAVRENGRVGGALAVAAMYTGLAVRSPARLLRGRR